MTVDLRKKKDQVESLKMKTTITKIKNSVDGFNCRVNTPEKRIR